MQQIFQNLITGETEIIEAPAPRPGNGQVLIETTSSLISIGTERMLVDFSRGGLLAKARSQPAKVRQVIEKARTDGVLTTIEAVRSKLGDPLPLGYSNVGRVRESRAPGYTQGDRVVSNGPHADVVCIPRNLCARIPDQVSDETASFTVVASIGLQGIRLANPTIGEVFVVSGVGLIGLLTVQILLAHGCTVLAIDFSEEKLALARDYGAETCNLAQGEDPLSKAMAISRGAGVDGVIITASTKSSEPVSQAAQMCRKRGRIVLVGVTGLELDRAEFYEKELSFQVSCSYGPGRYDPQYEQGGHDYPLGFVRWTEQRNFEAVLDLMARGSIKTERLVSHRFEFTDAAAAYDAATSDASALGIILNYGHDVGKRHVSTVRLGEGIDKVAPGPASVGFIGAGNYASRILIPAFAEAGADLRVLASAGGASAAIHGRRSGFARATSDTRDLLDDPLVDSVVVATRHDTHAEFVIAALESGKNVFVEKPLAIRRSQVDSIRSAHEGSGKLLMTGFNRRFAPLVLRMKSLIDAVAEPKCIMTVMNAGSIPPEHWTQDPEIGGGRIIGEACHHIDLIRYLVGAPIVSVQTRRMGKTASRPTVEDNAAILLGFADGSFGTVHYLANGSAAFPKERVEVFAAGRTLQLDNFLRLRGFGWRGFSSQRLLRQDKGQKACARAFVESIRQGGPAPIPACEQFETTLAAIEAAEQLAVQD